MQSKGLIIGLVAGLVVIVGAVIVIVSSQPQNPLDNRNPQNVNIEETNNTNTNTPSDNTDNSNSTIKDVSNTCELFPESIAKKYLGDEIITTNTTKDTCTYSVKPETGKLGVLTLVIMKAGPNQTAKQLYQGNYDWLYEKDAEPVTLPGITEAIYSESFLQLSFYRGDNYFIVSGLFPGLSDHKDKTVELATDILDYLY